MAGRGRLIRRGFELLCLLFVMNTWLILPPGVGAQATLTPAPPTATAVPTPTYVPGPASGSLQIDRVMDPTVVTAGNYAGVAITLGGQALSDCYGIPKWPVDAAMVFDISTSAGAGPGSNWERTVEWTQTLMNLLARPIYRTAIAPPEQSQVAFVGTRTGRTGPEPVLLQSFTADYLLLQQQLASLTPSGDTDIGAGIELATEELQKIKSERGQAIVLMLHDNTALDPKAQQVIREVEATGISIYLVANSLNLPAEKQITLALASPLVSAERVYLDPDVTVLRDLFLMVTDARHDIAAASILAVEELLPAGQAALVESSGPGAKLQGNQARWEIGALTGGERARLAYRMRLEPDAGPVLTVRHSIVWLDCNGYPHSSGGDQEIQIGVAPTPTPSAAPDSDSTATPEAGTRLTPGAGTPEAGTPEGVPVVPGGSSGPTETLPGGSGLGLPVFDPRWLLLILPLLLLLAIIWLLRRLRGRGGTKPILSQPGKRKDQQPIPRPPEHHRKQGEDVTQEWFLKNLGRRMAGKLIIRSWPRTDIIRDALQDGQDVLMKFRLELADRLIGELDAVLETCTNTDPLTDQTEIRRRLKITDFTLPDPVKRSENAALLLTDAYEVAKEHKATEIYTKDVKGELLAILEIHGYSKKLQSGEICKTVS